MKFGFAAFFEDLQKATIKFFWNNPKYKKDKT